MGRGHTEIMAAAPGRTRARLADWSDLRRGAFGTAVVSGGLSLLATLVTVRLLMHSTTMAAMFVAGLAAIWIVGRFGLAGLAGIGLAGIPWLVVLATEFPPLTKTFWSAGTAVVLLVLAFVEGGGTARFEGARARAHSKRVLLYWLGAALFFTPGVISLFHDGRSDQLIQVSKLAIFPMMIFVVLRAGGSPTFGGLAQVVVWSAAAAFVAHLVVGGVGLGDIGTKYGSGEVLGLADNVHDLAFTASVVGAAALRSKLPMQSRFVIVGLSAAVALGTGVRTGLVALAVAVLMTLIGSRFGARQLVVIAFAAIAVVVSGAGDVVTTRFEMSEQMDEFQPVQGDGELTGLVQSNVAGSGRFAIWRNSLGHYIDESPPHIVFGTGLGSIEQINLEGLGKPLVGHSDIVDVLVQLGVVGLAGLLLLWYVLVREAPALMPVAAIATFALVNGSLEYTAPIVIGVALSAAVLGARSESVDSISAPARGAQFDAARGTSALP